MKTKDEKIDFAQMIGVFFMGIILGIGINFRFIQMSIGAFVGMIVTLILIRFRKKTNKNGNK